MSRGWHRVKIGIIAATLSLCATAAFIRPTAPRRTPEPRAQDLYGVVMQELAAVREADYSRAYRQVSLSMQERYNIDDFTEYVRTERPELARFERIEFGAMSRQGRHALVPVYFFLRGGEIALVHYALVREEGRWKIDGSRVGQRWGRNHRVGGART
jgi:hypothetical protein